MNHTPVLAQVMFFGALLSAIMSTASGTLLAPSVTFTENILKGLIGHQSDRHFLWTMRAVVVCFTVAVTLFALTSTASIYEMVGNAYKVTLVAAFVPLVSGCTGNVPTPRGHCLRLAPAFAPGCCWKFLMQAGYGRRSCRFADERAGYAGGIAVARSVASAS